MKKILILILFIIICKFLFSQCDVLYAKMDGKYCRTYDANHNEIANRYISNYNKWGYSSCLVVFLRETTNRTYKITVYDKNMNELSRGYYLGNIKSLNVSNEDIIITDFDDTVTRYDKNMEQI